MFDGQVGEEGTGPPGEPRPRRSLVGPSVPVVAVVVVAVAAAVFAIAIMPGPCGSFAPFGWRTEWRFALASQLLSGLLVGFIVGMGLWLNDSRARKREQAARNTELQHAKDLLVERLRKSAFELALETLTGLEEPFEALVSELNTERSDDWALYDASYETYWKPNHVKDFQQWLQVSPIFEGTAGTRIDRQLLATEILADLTTVNLQHYSKSSGQPSRHVRAGIHAAAERVVDIGDSLVVPLAALEAFEHQQFVTDLCDPVRQWCSEPGMNIAALAQLLRNVLFALDNRTGIEHDRDELQKRLGYQGPPQPSSGPEK